MIHMPIHIQGLALSFHDKVCIDDFSCSIQYGDRIAIVGRNGSGKSTLLQRLKQGFATGDAEIRHSADIFLPTCRRSLPILKRKAAASGRMPA